MLRSAARGPGPGVPRATASAPSRRLTRPPAGRCRRSAACADAASSVAAVSWWPRSASFIPRTARFLALSIGSPIASACAAASPSARAADACRPPGHPRTRAPAGCPRPGARLSSARAAAAPGAGHRSLAVEAAERVDGAAAERPQHVGLQQRVLGPLGFLGRPPQGLDPASAEPGVQGRGPGAQQRSGHHAGPQPGRR